MHSKPCIINNLQGLCLRPPSDCELTQDSDRKNAHNLGTMKVLLPVVSRPTGGGSYEFSSLMIWNPTSNAACRNSNRWILRSLRIGFKPRRSSKNDCERSPMT